MTWYPILSPPHHQCIIQSTPRHELHAGSPPLTQQPTILLLREGTDTSEGKAQILSNINAIEAIVEVIKSTLGTPSLTQAPEAWTR